MGHPGLLKKLQDIAALLAQYAGDSKQPASADPILAGLDAMADLALDHRLTKVTLRSVLGGLDPLDSRQGPEAVCHLEQLPAGARSPTAGPG